jgi:hypothetical protein
MPHWRLLGRRREPNLPSLEELQERFFERWYDAAGRQLRSYGGINPAVAGRPRRGIPAAEASPLRPEGQAQVREQLARMLAAAREDWPLVFAVQEPVSAAWLEDSDRQMTPKIIRKLIERSDPADFTNDYLVYCCELGVVIGEVLMRAMPDLEWLCSWPYWESSIYHPAAVAQVNVFAWARKRMSAYGADDRLARKAEVTLEWLRADSV